MHRDISDWEQNTFAEFCGRDAKARPDRWRQLYARHRRSARGGREASPFISLGRYREELAGFIANYNSAGHERATLGGDRLVPLDEYRRLYPTRHEIAPESLALLLMKADRRVVRKNGVQCFQRHWFYWDDALSLHKGKKVEVRYSDGDYSRVWVVLPDRRICEAQLITPTSLLNPNKQTLKVVAERAHERRVMRDFGLITEARLRGETDEETAIGLLGAEAVGGAGVAVYGNTNAPADPAAPFKITGCDRAEVAASCLPRVVQAEEFAEVEADWSIFKVGERVEVNGFGSDQ